MKFASIIILLAGISIAACTKRNQPMNEPVQYFPTAAEAVSKAKADLLELMSKQKGLALNIDGARLEKGEAGAPVQVSELDFNKLMAGDSTQDIRQILSGNSNTIIPIIADNQVVTSVELVQEAKGWRIAGINNAAYLNGLRSIRETLKDTPAEKIAVYDVPNLNAKVFVVTGTQGDMYFADYPGRISPNERMDLAKLTSVLQADAREFYAKYGDLIRKQQLVK